MTTRMTRLLERSRSRKILACALVLGDPHLDATLEYMESFVENGVDVIELIVPFSDPTYHGRVIQRASARALREDIGWDEVEAAGRWFRGAGHDTVLLVSSYYNRVLNFGLRDAASTLADSGFDAAMVPDLPFEECAPFRDALTEQNLDLITMIAATTSDRRLDAILDETSGFLLWSGHAGGELTAGREIRDRMSYVRARSQRPVIAAMQISTPDEAGTIAEVVDGVIVASSIVWLVEGRGSEVGRRIGEFVGQLRGALDGE